MELLIMGARIVDENQDFIGDLYIKNGLIEDAGEKLEYNCETVDGKDLCLMPSFIDLHVHMREPGFTHKEDLVSGGLSALKGGFTFTNLMGNTNPICSSMEVVDYVLDRGKELDLIDIHQCVSITKEFDGQTLEHLDLLNNKVKMITDDGMGINSNIVMYRAMEKAKELGLIIMTHAEDKDLTPIDYRISENIITIRDIYLSKVTGAWLHLTHVSTKEAIEEIRRAKKDGGTLLTCDVTPHHIALWDLGYKVNPPIREEDDVRELISGIVDGTVDVIATDHAPHTAEDKLKGSPGLVGLETAFSVSYTTLVKSGIIDIKRLSQLLSANGAEIMCLNKGRIIKGYEADLVLVDLNKKIVVDSNTFVSKGKNTPFDGMEFYGDIEMTIKKGKIKYVNKSSLN